MEDKDVRNCGDKRTENYADSNSDGEKISDLICEDSDGKKDSKEMVVQYYG